MQFLHGCRLGLFGMVAGLVGVTASTARAGPGACCLPDGTCQVQDSCACSALGGRFIADSACVSGQCPQPTVFGACCYVGGDTMSCAVTWEGACSGVLFTAGITCASAACGGSNLAPCCCGAECRFVEEALCSSAQFVGQTCSPNPCGPGACCDELTGACAIVEYAALCEGFHLAGRVCESNPCPPVATGPCCDRETDACAITTQLECRASNGRYEGDGRTCDPTPCGYPCCLPPVHGGLGSVCRVLVRSACAAMGGTSTTIFTYCGPGYPDNPTLCCRVNFNGVGGVTVDDLFGFLEAYFALAPAADFNGVSGVSVQDLFDFLAAYFTGCG